MHMLATRWKMARMKEELGDAKHTKRITHLIDALGEMAHDALVLKSKSELGTWKWAVIDETNMRKTCEERQERKLRAVALLASGQCCSQITIL